ncbi:CBM96 family carbohydrate-binding protein [Sediminicola luteus]|uniref:DNRLRE domain-containing protein n=1 Tax=Sediminicola luteus TaxID=319238 RepID=A0ABV2TYB0_9FLAO
MILLIFVVFFQISCEKDSDLFAEAILLPENPTELENGSADEEAKDSLVSKTVMLSPINDAYVQEGKGYDDQIIRVQTNDRTSYLMFDLSVIEGELENVELQLTIDSDAGDGTIKIFKGTHNDWSENKLSATSAPGKDSEIAAFSKVFNTGVTENIVINKNLITNEKISLVLEQENGNDFSITSKENPNKMGPKLAVTYRTTKGEPQEEEANPNDSQTSSTEPFAYELKAFPTAVGFGKNATGGRGGKVIHVTNLNDNGPGSLRDALKSKGTRTVVFDVGGNIVLKSPLLLGSSNFTQNKAEENITIAGQTAPFPGITITGHGLNIYTSNVIIRYLTIRPNNSGDGEDAIRVRNWGTGGYVQSNIILDHVTLSHATDENIEYNGGSSFATRVTDFTLQNSMIGKGNSAYNMLIGDYAYNATIYGNYFSHENDRSVFFGYGLDKENAEMINNVIYGFQGATNIAYGSVVDLIGNVYKAFANTTPRWNVISYQANKTNNPNATETDGGLYVENNYFVNPMPAGTYDSGISAYLKTSRVITSSSISSWESTQRGIENLVFNSNVGNSIHRDALDKQLLADYATGGGGLSNISVPSKTATSRPDNYDTDKDGMADSWEIATFGDLSKTATGKDLNADYTNLEVFLHSLLQ